MRTLPKSNFAFNWALELAVTTSKTSFFTLKCFEKKKSYVDMETLALFLWKKFQIGTSFPLKFYFLTLHFER